MLPLWVCSLKCISSVPLKRRLQVIYIQGTLLFSLTERGDTIVAFTSLRRRDPTCRHFLGVSERGFSSGIYNSQVCLAPGVSAPAELAMARIFYRYLQFLGVTRSRCYCPCGFVALNVHHRCPSRGDSR